MIRSIERAVAILEIIARHGGAARLAEIATQAKLGKMLFSFSEYDRLPQSQMVFLMLSPMIAARLARTLS